VLLTDGSVGGMCARRRSRRRLDDAGLGAGGWDVSRRYPNDAERVHVVLSRERLDQSRFCFARDG
jgi:hypothetical protein